MKSRQWGLVVVVVLMAVALNVFIIGKRYRRGADSADKLRAETTRTMAGQFRRLTEVTTTRSLAGYDFELIGGLVKSPGWKRQLPLAEAQSSLLLQLDFLGEDVTDLSRLADADYYDTNPVDYLEYRDRGTQRLSTSAITRLG